MRASRPATRVAITLILLVIVRLLTAHLVHAVHGDSRPPDVVAAQSAAKRMADVSHDRNASEAANGTTVAAEETVAEQQPHKTELAAGRCNAGDNIDDDIVCDQGRHAFFEFDWGAIKALAFESGQGTLRCTVPNM